MKGLPATASRRGFTLIELLVVTAILALLVAAIGACVAAGIRVWDTARRTGLAETETAVFLRVLQRDLMNAFRFYAVPFSGEATAVSFPGLTVGTDGPPAGDGHRQDDYRVATLGYRFDPSTRCVFRTQQSFPEGARQETKLLTLTDNFRLQYAAAPGRAGATVAWTDRWVDATNFPERVQIVFSTSRGADSMPCQRTFILPVTNVRPEDK